MPAAISRFAPFALLWIVLTGADAAALWFGLPTAIAAAALSLRLYPADRPALRLGRAALFAPSLLARGLAGGLDVARRALDPRLPVAPGWVRFGVPGQPDELRVLLAGVISVLPGTLAASPSAGALDVHALQAEGFDPESLRADERRMRGLLRVPGRGADG